MFVYTQTQYRKEDRNNKAKRLKEDRKNKVKRLNETTELDLFGSYQHFKDIDLGDKVGRSNTQQESSTMSDRFNARTQIHVCMVTPTPIRQNVGYQEILEKNLEKERANARSKTITKRNEVRPSVPASFVSSCPSFVKLVLLIG